MQEKFCFVQLLKELNSLRKNVSEKKEEILFKSSLINKRVEDLLHSGMVQIDQQEYTQSTESIVKYAALLDGICVELDGEIATFNMLSCNTQEEDIEKKIKATKRNIKTIEQDLSISYSRYCYGFDSQTKRIDKIESMINKKDKQ